MKSLAKFFNHDFKNGDFKLYNVNNTLVYLERSNGFWYKQEFDKYNNLIYHENSNKEWYKKEFDKNNNLIYCKDSDGFIKDNRPKYENKTVVIDGIEYELRRKQ